MSTVRKRFRRSVYFYYLFFFLRVGQCDEGELMLAGNALGNAVLGRENLFVCEDQEFVAVCSGQFETFEARAACRQLGFVDGGKFCSSVM